MRLSCNDARNSCRSRIEFYFCDAARKKLHRVTPPKNPVVRKVARKVAPCVRDLRSDFTEELKKKLVWSVLAVLKHLVSVQMVASLGMTLSR